MPLDYAVRINCKNGATTEYQGADVRYMGKGVYVDDYVCVIWLNMTTPPWWRKSWYIIIIIIIIIIIFPVAARRGV